MHTNDAFFGGHAEAKREAVVAGSAMHVEAVAPTCPHSVIGDLRAEEAQERPGESEAHEPDLSPVRMAGEHEVSFSFR